MREGVDQSLTSRHHPGILSRVTEEKPWKNLNQDGRSLGLNPRPPECWATVARC